MITLAFFRLKLLLKQKLGWGIFAAAILFFPFALFLSFSSYVRPDKIYFDLSLSFCFIVATLLATYMGTHLYQEESQRKTLSFVLTLKSTRKSWLIGNWLGISAMLALAIFVWSVLITIVSLSTGGQLPPAILYQAQVFLFLETLIVLGLSMVLSLFLKPLLAWFAVLAFVALMHSKSYLEILVIEANFQGVTKFIYNSVLFIMNFLPPLEWWDIRIFVGFQAPLSFDQFFVVTALSSAWTFIFLFFAHVKLETMDL